MPAAPYWELTVAALPEAAEALQNFAWELGALGVVEEESPGGPPRLRAFFPPTADPPAIAAALREYVASLRTLGVALSDEGHVTPLADPGWAEAWRAHFRPVPVGRRLLVRPPWEREPAGERLSICIEPGRAFGTGHHATTAGCLELIEDIVERERPARALDLGTGSGILAIAALRLGVAEVTAVDEDPDAVSNARLNAAANGVAARLHCAVADAGALDARAVPLVVANLTAPAHRRLAAAYRRYLAPAGTLVAGGILASEAAGACRAFAAEGLARRRALERAGWTTVALTAD